MTVRRAGLAWLPAMMLLAVPKCPLCLLAFGGVLGTVGTTLLAPVYHLGLSLLTAIALLVAVASLAWLGHRRRSYGWPLCATLGAFAVLTGKFWMPSGWLLGTGLLLLLAATSRVACAPWPHRGKRRSGENCH